MKWRSRVDAHQDLVKPAGPNLGTAPPRGAEAPRRGMFASLAHRPYRRYWTGLFLSNIGTWMQSVAQGWLVLRLSNSAFLLGLVGFAGSIPTLLLAPLAGVAADRLDRRKLLLATQATQMACAFTLAAAVWGGFASVALVAGVAIVNGVANALHDAVAPDALPRSRGPRGPDQRDRPELDAVQPLAHRRTGARGPDHRRVRRGRLLRVERSLLRRDPRRARGPPRRCRPRAAGPAAPGSTFAPACASPGATRSSRSCSS